MADNTITVSAIDRSKVEINGPHKVDREKAILALSVGQDYDYKASAADLKFFFNVELLNNSTLTAVAAFTVFAFGLFLATFWDSSPDSGALVIVAASIIAFFSRRSLECNFLFRSQLALPHHILSSLYTQSTRIFLLWWTGVTL
jgi:hypothetical protein